VRAFIAVEMPRHITAALEAVQNSLKPFNLKIRWVRPETIHLTLKFLGDIRPDTVDSIGRVLLATAAAHEPLSLWAKGGGVFPGVRNPRVIWTGLSGQVQELQLLHRALETNLTAIGFESENRPFRGHLTLGRAKGVVDPVKLSAALDQMAAFATEPFTAERIILFQSDLKASGAVYTPLTSADLVRRS